MSSDVDVLYSAETQDEIEMMVNVSSLHYNYEEIRHYVYYVLLPVIMALGVFGNILNLIVFTRRRLREGVSEVEKASTTGLLFLAVADLLFCLTGLVGHLLSPFKTRLAVAYYFVTYQKAVVNTLLFISTWLVVVLSVERYVAVSFPFRTRQFVRVRKTVFINLGVYVFSILFNVPLFLEYKVVRTLCHPNYYYEVRLGHYGSSEVFQRVYSMVWGIMGTFLPLAILIMCNIKFLLEIYRSKMAFSPDRNQSTNSSRGSPLGAANSSNSSSTHSARLTRITIILIAIIFMFFLLVCPSMILDFLNTQSDMKKWSKDSLDRFRTAMVFTNLTQAINFSLNFLLYCSLSREFRRALRTIVCRWRAPPNSQTPSPTSGARTATQINMQESRAPEYSHWRSSFARSFSFWKNSDKNDKAATTLV